MALNNLNLACFAARQGNEHAAREHPSDARQAGLPLPLVENLPVAATFHATLGRVLGELLDEEVALLTKLLGRRRCSSSELSRKATWRFDRSQWREGFVLAIAAAMQADEEQRPEGPMLRIRAAQALISLGDTERAVPLLEDAVARDWRQDATLWLNNHFLHSAYVSLFDLCFTQQPERARALFWKANECFGSQGFPWVRPVQADLAKRFAATPGWEREAAHLSHINRRAS